MTLNDLKSTWQDTADYHKDNHEFFCQFVNDDPLLDAHRTYVEQHIWGFGERSFWYLWKLIMDALPEEPKILEIGVFRGATLSLWGLLNSNAEIYGITPLDTSGDVWESDYAADIKKIHDDFDLAQPIIIKGKSQEANVISQAKGKYDLVYIDGLHTYEGCLADLENYAPMVKKEGYLVIDDANTDMSMPWGYFQGIFDVTEAKKTWFSKTNGEWEFVCSVVHIAVYRRVG